MQLKRDSPAPRQAAAPDSTGSARRGVRSSPNPSPGTWPAQRPQRLEAVSSLTRSESQHGSARSGPRYLGDLPAAPAPTLERRGPRCRGRDPRQTQNPSGGPVPTGAASLADGGRAKGRPGYCHREKNLARRRAPRSGREPTPRHHRRPIRARVDPLPSLPAPANQRGGGPVLICMPGNSSANGNVTGVNSNQ